jgi:hypothetical protein
MSKQTADKIAALEREIAALKAAQAPPTSSFKPMSAAEHFDQMHAAAEARANQFVTLSPERRREMEKACGTDDLRDLVHASHAPRGPSAEGIVPGSQLLTSVRAGGGSGWQREIPLGPQPGHRYIDRIADEFDRRDRVELAQRLAAQKAAMKA